MFSSFVQFLNKIIRPIHVLVRFLALEGLQWCLTFSIDLGVREAVIRPRPKYTCKMWLADIPPPGDSGEVMRVSNGWAIRIVVVRRLSVTYLLPFCKLKHKHKSQ